jgi:serine phosphatase RsbU (regulator of sigma subunit)
VLGSLFMTTRDDASTFTDADVELAEALGRRAAVALDNARRFRVEHDMAATLQRSLLPQSLPETPGVQHCARYLPAATEAEVGGDWYDVIALADGSVAFVVGDVAGKGVQAAAVMGQLRSSARAYIWEGHQPADVLSRLDQLFSALDLTDFTTAAVGIYQPGTRRMTYSVAGHPPILLVTPTGETSYLRSGTGTPLGVATGEFSNDSLVLDPGSTLVLYTDGLIERRGESIDSGLERLRAIAGAAYDGLEQMSDAIVSELIPSSGAPDDVALLLVHTA